MNKKVQKLLENHSLAIDIQVTNFLLKQAGVVVKDMGIKTRKVKKSHRISKAMIKRLAGV